MMEPANSQDNFSFRLAQWLVEQFDSHEALGTVSNQLATLISQEQPDSRTNLNVHIGGLIFKKATHNPTDGLAQLCTRLCHSLFLQDIRRDSSFSSQCIHDRTFQLCIGSLEAINLEQKDDPGVGSLPDISVLVTELYNCGLIPIAHVYAYLRRLTTSNGPLESRLLGLCTILEATGWALNFGPWKTETESVIQWANDTVEKSPLDEYVKTRIKTATYPQNGGDEWQLYSEPGLPDEEQGPLGLATPEQYKGSTRNPPAQSQASDDAVSSHHIVDPEHNRVERNESSATEGTPPSPSMLSEADAQTPNSQGDSRPSESASPAQSIADGENPNRNNHGHNTVAHDGEIQSPQSVASPPQLATTTPVQVAPSAVPPRGPGVSGFEPSNPARPATPTASSTHQSAPAVRPTTPQVTAGLGHRPAAGSISFGIADAPENKTEPARAPAPAPALATRSKASNPSVSAWSKGPPSSASITSRARLPFSNAPAASPAQSRRQTTVGPAAGQPAVKKPTTLRDNAGTGYRPAAGSISFGIVDSAPRKRPGPAQALAAAAAPATTTPALKPTNDINVVAPTPSALKPAAPASSTSTSPPATPNLKQKKLNVHALFPGGGVPTPTATTTPPAASPDRPAGSPRMAGAVPLHQPGQPHHQMHSYGYPGHPEHPGHPTQQKRPGYYPPQGYYDPYMHWQHQPHMPQMPQMHTPPRLPSLPAQTAERKTKEEEERKAREEDENTLYEFMKTL